MNSLALAHRVVGQVEDVVGFVVRQMDLEQVQTAIDQVGQAEAADDFLHDTDAAVGKAAGSVSDLVMDVRGCEHRSFGVADLGFVEAAVNAALAVVELLSYFRLHSKSLSVRAG